MKQAKIHQAKTKSSQPVNNGLAGTQMIPGKAKQSPGTRTAFAHPAKMRVGGQLRGEITESAGYWQSDA